MGKRWSAFAEYTKWGSSPLANAQNCAFAENAEKRQILNLPTNFHSAPWSHTENKSVP